MSRSDWISLALTAIADPATDALTLEGLCERAQKTRGSFYHHFESVDALVWAALDEWEKAATTRIIEELETRRDSTTPARERLMKLDRKTRALDARLEQGVRRLANTHTDARKLLKRVDAARVAYLEEIHRSAGQPEKRAAALARIEYAAFVGLQQIDPAIVGKDLDALYAVFLDLIEARE